MITVYKHFYDLSVLLFILILKIHLILEEITFFSLHCLIYKSTIITQQQWKNHQKQTKDTEVKISFNTLCNLAENVQDWPSASYVTVSLQGPLRQQTDPIKAMNEIFDSLRSPGWKY